MTNLDEMCLTFVDVDHCVAPTLESIMATAKKFEQEREEHIAAIKSEGHLPETEEALIAIAEGHAVDIHMHPADVASLGAATACGWPEMPKFVLVVDSLVEPGHARAVKREEPIAQSLALVLPFEWELAP